MITYKLIRENSPQSKGYVNTRYPKHFALPGIAHVSVFNKDKKTYERRTIRYCQGEISVFLDEQSPDSEMTKEHLTFSDGTLTVNPKTRPNLATYLSLLDSNSSKKDRDTSVEPIFEEYNVNKLYEDAMAVEETKMDVLNEFMAMPLEKKRALAHLMGLSTSDETARWTYNLLTAVNASREASEAFLENIQDPVLDKIDIISRAEEMNILKYSNFRWTFEGVEVMKADRTQNPYMEMARFLSDNRETWENLQNKVLKRNEKFAKPFVLSEDDNDEEEVTEITEKKVDAEKLFEQARKNKQITYHHGKGFIIVKTKEVLGKSAAKSIEALEKEKRLRDDLQA